ncbi:GLPGLI family protein [Ornithobacterium rhinotracheale]
MRKINLFMFFAIFFNITLAQTKKVVYAEYLFNNNNANELNVVNLFFDKNHSFSEFVNINSKNAENESESDNNLRIDVNIKPEDAMIKQYYVTKDSIVFLDYIYSDKKFVPVLVSEKTPKYNWKLEDEDLKIGDLSCKKATLNFRGRNYIAWYTLDIPTPFGPWKFYGLPGLPIRISTDDNSIAFNLTKLSYIAESDKIKPPSQGEKMTLEEYIKINENSIKELMDKFSSKLPRGTTITTTKVENNGIEKEFK